jgi:hypothetical protein
MLQISQGLRLLWGQQLLLLLYCLQQQVQG